MWRGCYGWWSWLALALAECLCDKQAFAPVSVHDERAAEREEQRVEAGRQPAAVHPAPVAQAPGNRSER